MDALKRQMLRRAGQWSAARVAALSRQYLTAKPEDREAIMAGIDFERWMTKMCEFCLN